MVVLLKITLSFNLNGFIIFFGKSVSNWCFAKYVLVFVWVQCSIQRNAASGIIYANHKTKITSLLCFYINNWMWYFCFLIDKTIGHWLQTNFILNIFLIKVPLCFLFVCECLLRIFLDGNRFISVFWIIFSYFDIT